MVGLDEMLTQEQRSTLDSFSLPRRRRGGGGSMGMMRGGFGAIRGGGSAPTKASEDSEERKSENPNSFLEEEGQKFLRNLLERLQRGEQKDNTD